ncbi:MAG: polysaccharide biosynthesis tyrosine autokinase [Acidobacteria bacterium]|nr:polysaccharide biosynthesis tyrosine autokinase [Acidobacteriota bacterium]
MNDGTQNPGLPEDAADAWRRGRASVTGTPVGASRSGTEASSPDGEAPSRPGRNAQSEISGGSRISIPRQLPDPGAWAAPIELQPGVHYKAFTLPPGYVPSYPIPPGQGKEGEQQTSGLVEYWRLLRRRRGVVALIAAIGLILAVLITLPMTPVYTARTSVEIQDTNQDFLNMKSVQQFSSESGGWMLMTDIQTHIRVLQSMTLLDRAAKKMSQNLPPSPAQEPGRMSAWRRALNLPEQQAEDSRVTALSMARGSVRARAQGQTRIIEISADSTDKQMAAEFVNVLTNEFIEQNMEARWQQTQKTGDWLARQLDEMKIKLERSEDQLQDYARRSGLLFTAEKSSVSEDRLKQLQQALSAATAERVSKQSRFEMAKNASPESLPDVINDAGLRDLQGKLTELQRQAAELKATYNDKYPKLQKLDPQVRWLESQVQRERAAILAKIKNENDEAVRKESLLRADYETQARLVRDEGEKGVHYGILKREVDSNRQLYESMLQRVKEASLAGALRASNIRVVDPARTPGAPSRPNLPNNAFLGLLGGLLCGVAFVVTTDKANNTFRDPGDVQFYLNLPELGVIPSEKAQVGSYAKRKLKAAVHNEKLLLSGNPGGAELTQRIELTVHQQKTSMLAESFRATLTSILFSGENGQRPRALVVTSSGPGEGKSTVVSNLAAALGEIHQRVLLIDADTRKPRQHDIFGVPNDTGLTTLLLDTRSPGDVDLEEVILPTRVNGVFIMPAGPAVASITNLLYSGRMEEYVEVLTRMFDVVLIDTPPMLQIPDARVLGRMAGGVVLVLRTARTTRDAALAVRQRLQEDGTRILGTILNDWNPKASPGGYYGYRQGYYQSYKSYYSGKNA